MITVRCAGSLVFLEIVQSMRREIQSKGRRATGCRGTSATAGVVVVVVATHGSSRSATAKGERRKEEEGDWTNKKQWRHSGDKAETKKILHA